VAASDRFDQGESRKHPAHPVPVDRFNEPIIVFLTVCSKERKRILASAEICENLVAAWISAVSWCVGRYVVMPDHIHLFCSPADYPRVRSISGSGIGRH
jgi:REP element-mobilizing transposase RayT